MSLQTDKHGDTVTCLKDFDKKYDLKEIQLKIQNKCRCQSKLRGNNIFLKGDKCKIASQFLQSCGWIVDSQDK